MALGTRKQRIRQETLWIAKHKLPASAAHPFYTRLNELLDAEKFDEFAEAACKGSAYSHRTMSLKDGS